LGKIESLDRLFNPSSIAVVGASNDRRKSGGRFVSGLIGGNYHGKVYPVNPRESEIMGLASYPRVTDIPVDIDLAFVAVPATLVPQVIDDCSQHGVKIVVVHSAGFSELGTEGKKLEEEMLRSAGQGSARIIGPNCMGFYCPEAGINTVAIAPATIEEAGSIAFVGQSGWVCENIIVMGYELGLRFSKVLSIGNQSDLTIEDLLEYLAEDDSTRVIGLYVEGIKRGREFLRLVRQVSKKKPVLIWKTGRTEIGARAAASHTGSLAGSDAVFNAALAQGGAAVARNLEELLDLMVGFTSPFLPAGSKIGLLVEAGGGAVASADAATSLGFEIPELSPQSQKDLVDVLKDVIPPFSRPRNPVDIVWTPATDPNRVYLECSRIILKEVDALVVLCYARLDDSFTEQLVALGDETGKPILFVPGHPTEQKAGMALLIRNGISTFTIPERALRVLSAMVVYSDYSR